MILMTLNFEETISEERLEQGRSLYDLLNELDREEKNAIIGFRCVSKDLPDSLDNDDLEWIEFKTSLEVLTEMGVCFINEEDLRSLLDEFQNNAGNIYSDHRAWSILTVLELDDHMNFDSSYLEANIYDNGSKLNPIAIDLVGKSDYLHIATCKFNITTQRESALDKAEELRSVSDDIEEECVICLGTLSIQYKERIEAQVGAKFDEIVSGVDILDLE